MFYSQLVSVWWLIRKKNVRLTSSWEDMFADRSLCKETDLKGATCLEQGKVAIKTNIVRLQGLWLSSDE